MVSDTLQSISKCIYIYIYMYVSQQYSNVYKVSIQLRLISSTPTINSILIVHCRNNPCNLVQLPVNLATTYAAAFSISMTFPIAFLVQSKFSQFVPSLAYRAKLSYILHYPLVDLHSSSVSSNKASRVSRVKPKSHRIPLGIELGDIQP